MIPVPIQTLGIDTIQMIDPEISFPIDTGIISTIGIEVTQTVEISDTKTTDREIIQTTGQIIINLTTIIIKIDHEITRKLEIQIITINKEYIVNHLIGMITVTPILKTNIEVKHQNIKYKQLKKQSQTPLVLIAQKTLNYY